MLKNKTKFKYSTVQHWANTGPTRMNEQMLFMMQYMFYKVLAKPINIFQHLQKYFVRSNWMKCAVNSRAVGHDKRSSVEA
jgi:hypothetical protein